MKSNNSSASTNKVPFYKKWWFYAIIVVVLLSSVFGSSNDENSDQPTIPPTANTTSNNTTVETASQEKLTFELVAGEQGEYGKMITYNKDTEFEENFYAYYIPAGTYTVTNIGDYLTQVNVYSDEIAVNSSGWEEPAEIFFADRIEIGETKTIVIEDGQHIEIAEPTKLMLELQ